MVYRRLFIIALLLLSSQHLYGQNEIVLSNFEDPGFMSKWDGLVPFRQSASHSSSGQYGMAFDIPRWDEEGGADPRPRVRLPFANGKGFPSKDWSIYGAIAIDVWLDGADSGGFGIKILDGTGASSWTTWIDVKPGRLYQAVLTMEEASGDVDITDVQAIVLYALRPKHPYTITVDRLRWLPKEPIPVAVLELAYPNYRNWIFPQARSLEVAARMNAQEYGYRLTELQMELSWQAGSMSRKITLPVQVKEARYAITLAESQPRDLTFKAQVVRKSAKTVLLSREWHLEKLEATDVAKLPVYIDRDNNTIVDGKPFFPLGFYASSAETQINEIADSPYNTLLIYSTNHMPKAQMITLLDKLVEKKLKLIYCMNDVYPRATYLEKTGWEGLFGNEAISQAVVEAYRNHPAILAWYLNDELPREQLPELEDYYRRVRELDPGHPTLITLCQKKDFSWLWKTTDILSGDPYPIPQGTVTEVVQAMKKAKQASMGSQAVWLVPQSFAWYQHDPQKTDRSRIPSQKDLDTGRAPNYAEGRCMTYLGLVHGAKGLIYWCYYNMRVLPQYQEMWTWMKSIGEEVKELSSTLLTAQDLGAVSLSPEIKDVYTMLRKEGDSFTLLAVYAGAEKCEPTFQVNVPAHTTIQVKFENRSLASVKNSFSDRFEPLAVHVYRWQSN
jgi:hypothetical protein